MAFRSLSVNLDSMLMTPLFLPRLITLVVTPIFSNRPPIATLPPTTPIEPVSVPGSAKIRLAPIEM